ncbi:S-layer homology domain-containing protein [Brachybacterium sp. JHP9]|uniref:S-layer homology domain-containing protein n=1 Tax=Brachybacterium equifaecis TaxID=2910770 RepID=A0ABT0QWU4_9MICO|nr:S-layer homology domain-containing protein [Brachybacterium equifaecis]MCL6422145.1 S-layer homology domain-containing protein [Brachybacterium equifaecis]
MTSPAPRTSLTARPLAVLGLLAALLLALPITAARAETPPGGIGGFDPGLLITDALMFDGGALGAAEIDAFLDERGASCRTGVDGAPCLKDLAMSTPQREKTAYCAAIPAGTAQSAGQILAAVSAACGVSPKALLVMLQKEQGLVTTAAPTWKKLDQALGFACPDFLGCDPAKAGFAQQIYQAGSRLQEYGDPARGFRYQAGRTYDLQYSPFEFCGTGRVSIANRATAALYNYTPFTPSQAALDAGAGVVADDVCATYGNRNFYRIYATWFGSPTGADPTPSPIAAPSIGTPKAPFTDVRHGQSQFFVEIAWLKHQKLATGWADGTYRPYQPIGRDAMAAFLYRAAGSPEFTPPVVSPFTDVTPQTQYYREITWAQAQGITTGYPDGTFRPTQPIARDAMAAFLYRAAGSPAHTPPASSPLGDITPESTIFYREITWAASQRISTGWPDGTYRPAEPISREAMAAFVYRWKVA